MATLKFPAQRLMVAGGFAVAVVFAPAAAILAATASDVAPVAQACPPGEENDVFTNNCHPHTVPNSGASPFKTLPGNPDVPTVMGIPCAGHNSGECIGLAEEQEAMTVTPPPAPVFGDGRN